jgi:hypothetical protein
MTKAEIARVAAQAHGFCIPYLNWQDSLPELAMALAIAPRQGVSGFVRM